MENSVGKSGGTEISKKTRSLDLQSLYESRVGKEGHNKRKSGVEDDGVIRKKKRKSRKEVSLSSFEPAGKKSRKSLDVVYFDGVSSDSGNLDKSQSGSSQKLDSSSGLNSISLNLDDNGNVIRIPKRRRGFVGRKKCESNQVSKHSGLSSSQIDGSLDQITKLNGKREKFENNQVAKTSGHSGSKASLVNEVVKLNGDSVGTVVNTKPKRKAGFDDFNANSTSGVNSAQHAKEEDDHLVVNSCDASSRKRRSNHRKRKDLASGSESVAEKFEPSVDSLIKFCDEFQDEDEENLEQNAARMLSSRFDPRCTGFSSKSRSSTSPSANGKSLLIPSSQDFVGRGESSLAGLESASADSASRVLRPRNQHNEKGLARKRRHFYELLSRDLDACWVLNRRIKVFWPLDERWYYGLVNDYDPERGLHHIKYDDQDEEWINLQNERFKLLLLPNEVPGKAEPKQSAMGDKHADNEERDLTMDEDSYAGSYMDSEPIISWLARSSRRVKSSPFSVMRRQKTSHLSPNFVPPLLPDKTDNANVCFDDASSERDTNKPYFFSALPERLTGARRGDKSELESTTSSKDSKVPVVYFRRRFRKKGEGLCHLSEDNNACGSAPGYVASLAPVVDSLRASKEYNGFLGCLDSGELLWSIDNAGLLKLNIPLIESKEFRFELHFPVPSVLKYPFGAENFWFFRTTLLLQYGTLISTWPMVHLEMLFVDNVVGLRFLLFEGCLKQAVAFVFLVLTVFHQPDEQGKYVDLGLPVTSIRFKLSCIRDLRKQHVFAFYSFSKVKYSKWLYLDHKLRRHCLLTRQLPLSECTYDNIKALEGGSDQSHTNSVSGQPSSFEGSQKKYMQGIMPMGVSKESCSVNMSQSSSNSDVKHGKLPPFALSFTAAPTFFRSLHLKLLMEHNVACISLRDRGSMYSLEHSVHTCRRIADDCTLPEDFSDNISEVAPGSNLGTSLREATCSGRLSCAKPQLGSDAIPVCDDGARVKSSRNFQNGKLNVSETSACTNDPGKNAVDVVVQSQNWGCNDLESKQFVTPPQLVVPKDHASSGMSGASCHSSLNGISVKIPSFDQVERPVDGRTHSAQLSADLAWNMNDDIVHSPNPTGPRSMWHRNRNSPSSLSSGDFSHAWPDGKADFIRNGFGNGPKKPRTQVQYTMPLGGFDFSSKHKIHNQRGIPYKRIRRANEKKSLDGSRSSQRNLELLACDANVLITHGDRGWRECGVLVVLELADHNEWRLAVKLSGMTKYSYKATHLLQPGSTNRYTHAMMWKGGKDWVLEFPDRSQWMLFKEMHEECYNRNVRAASVKNIPIPGVRLIEESDDNGTEVPFVRSSPKYFRQVETDVDMAMDPSRILYDIDSDDEQWILKNQKSSDTNESKCEEISEDLFEKTMDMFEKVAYSQQRDHFTSDEIEELMAGVGPMEVIKVIHKHWQQKRQRKGMPLIRQLQPPLWERYRQQVKEWEQAMTKANSSLSNGCHEKAPPTEKPPMFAFCLKPRGLEVPNKGSKQRSQRKFPVSGHTHAVLGDQDALHAFGRRLNGFAFGDEKVIFPGSSHESSDASPLFQTSMRAFSPRDTGGPGYLSLSSDGSEWNHHPKLHRNKSKKIGTFLPTNNPQMVASYNQRTIGKRNGVRQWNMGLPEWPSQKHYQSEGSQRHAIEQLDGSDLDEFRLRDASGAAQHALNMAKLKREKAQRLLYRADLAIHKAVVALMTAEAIKASFEDSNGDG
uniref:Enhancer of polycomb-like protein n=1 Tax=Davidia involucrata TaxID=16924 RepID=A0A5B6ZB44_DAVIN